LDVHYLHATSGLERDDAMIQWYDEAIPSSVAGSEYIVGQ